MPDNIMPDDSNSDAVTDSKSQEEKKEGTPVAVAAEVAPVQINIVRAPDVKCVKPIRETFLYLGPDPATDTIGQIRGPSTSVSKIEGAT